MPEAQAQSANAPTEQDRDRYLRLLDNARDRGLLDVDEHTHKVLSVGAARSMEELNTIVWELPVMQRAPHKAPSPATESPLSPASDAPLSPASDTSRTGEGGSEGMPKLDPVDIAMLRLHGTARKPEPSRRWAALIAVAVIFVVLMVLGIVLALHTKEINSNKGGLLYPRPPHTALAPRA